MWRSSGGTLFRLAGVLAAPLSEPAVCSRLLAAEGLLRCCAASAACRPDGGAAAAAAASVTSLLQQRGYSRQQDNPDQLGEPRDDWEFGYRTDHIIIDDRPRILEDYEELIGVLARRRRSPRALPTAVVRATLRCEVPGSCPSSHDRMQATHTQRSGPRTARPLRVVARFFPPLGR